MTTILTVLGLVVAFYRIRKGLFTRLEWIVLVSWAVHFGLEELQLIGDCHRFKYDPRYFRPVDFVTWGWTAWGFSKYWQKVKCLVLLALFAAVVYDAVMLVKSKIPGSRRHAYVQACDWAVEKIRVDWDGPAMDRKYDFYWNEYHRPNRPIVGAHTARLPYLLNGQLTFRNTIGDVNIQDYWFDNVDREDPPTNGYYRVDAYQCGEYRFELYRRQGKGGFNETPGLLQQ